MGTVVLHCSLVCHHFMLHHCTTAWAGAPQRVPYLLMQEGFLSFCPWLSGLVKYIWVLAPLGTSSPLIFRDTEDKEEQAIQSSPLVLQLAAGVAVDGPEQMLGNCTVPQNPFSGTFWSQGPSPVHLGFLLLLVGATHNLVLIVFPISSSHRLHCPLTENPGGKTAHIIGTAALYLWQVSLAHHYLLTFM